MLRIGRAALRPDATQRGQKLLGRALDVSDGGAPDAPQCPTHTA